MHVLISGAGIAGPTLAYFLAKAGIQSTVVEKASSLLAQGQNIDISGSAVIIAQKMGVLEKIKANNTTEKGTQFVNSNNKPFAEFPINEDTTASGTSEYEILRGDLAKILYEASEGNQLVEYRFGTTVERVLSNDEDSIKVQFSDGKVEQFDLLVAADGQWSKLRKQCLPQGYLNVKDKGMYNAWYTVPRLPQDNNLWNIYVTTESKVLSTRPDPYNTIRATLAYMPRNANEAKAWYEASRAGRKAQQEIIRREFHDAGWQVRRLLDEMEKAEDFYFNAVSQIRLSKWSKSRFICLGDTAYAPTPLTGMGTSLAIDGAYALAGELSLLKDGEPITKALDAYEAKFRPFVEKTQDIPFFVPGIMFPGTATKRWMLKTFLSTLATGISLLSKIPWATSAVKKPETEDFPITKYAAFED